MASTNQPLLHTPHKTTSNYFKPLFLTISISTLVIVSVILLPDLAKTTTHNYLSSSPSHICREALNPQSCQQFVTEVVCDGLTPPHGAALLRKFLIKQAHHMNTAISHTRRLKNQMNNNGLINQQGALSDCLHLIDLSIDLVLKALENRAKSASHADTQAWLSAVLTNHVTCLDGLNSHERQSLGATVEEMISRASASLAILARVSQPDTEMFKSLRGNLPSWITAADRKLMQSSGNAVKADLTVAKDGSGNYKTVAEAIAKAPDKSKSRYVIYVKKGTYKENVEVGKNKKNLMIIGDGIDSTIITGDRNVVDNYTTFNSATLAAVGEGFILQDITIKNTAGPEKHQAVALRLGADLSVVNRCKLDAYQDTLYTHSLRQFFRDCQVTGTVDFIFGNAAVVFQKCKLVPRKPMKSQKNMVTAQGRTDPNQNTAISIQDCEIAASADLEPVKGSFPTYLGRPWKEYSRTVVMQSSIGDVIDPAGWSEWSGDFALKTLYYGEYLNRGAGAGTAKRVKWSGYHVIKDAAEAAKFTVKELIQGGEWIGNAGVAYTEGL